MKKPTEQNAPMPSGTASRGQEAVAPDQSRLDRKTAGERGPIEFAEERLRVRGALRVFRLRQFLFRRPRCSRAFPLCAERRFRERGFRRSVFGWAARASHRQRSLGWAERVVDAGDGRLLRV